MGAPVRWSITLPGDYQDIHNLFHYKERDVGFNTSKNLKMTLHVYSQTNPHQLRFPREVPAPIAHH